MEQEGRWRWRHQKLQRGQQRLTWKLEPLLLLLLLLLLLMMTMVIHAQGPRAALEMQQMME